MITLGAKLYFGLTAAALAAAFVLGLATDGSILGVLTFAWAGPIGDQLGYTVLVGTAAASFFLGVTVTALRDADPEAQTEVAGTETLPAATPPAFLSPWPIVAAFGVASLLIGVVVDVWLVVIGIVLLLIAGIEWTVDAYTDRATGDPAANRAIRNRLMAPLETPGAPVLGVFAFVFFASRVLLAVPTVTAIVIFASAAVIVLVAATVIANRPDLSRTAITGLALLGGLALVGGGIAGVASGEREFHDLGSGNQRQHQSEAPSGIDQRDDLGLDTDGGTADTGDDTDSSDDTDDSNAGDSSR